MEPQKTAFPAHPAASRAVYHHPGSWDRPIPVATLPDVFATAAAAHGERALVEFMGARSSYAALHREARRFAAGLRAAGVSRGDRVGLFLPNVPIYVAAYYGAMMAGAVVVNFSPLYSVEELAAQVEDSGTRLLVTLDVAALLPTAVRVLDSSALEGLVVGRLADALPRVQGWLLKRLGRKRLAPVPARADITVWHDFVGDDADFQPAALAPNDLALLQYTGGTTGRPKGAMLTHANLTANAYQVNAIDPFDRNRPDVIVGGLPLFHVFANTCVLNRTVVSGGTIVMLARFSAADALKIIETHRPTSFPGVPTMYQAMLDERRALGTDFSSLEICVSGGAPLPERLAQRFEALSGVPLVEGYGLTESAGVVSANPYRGNRKQGTIGQLLPQTRVILLDKEDPAKLAPHGEPGELAVCGPQVMRGYWNRPDSHAATFARHFDEDWLRTGDIATIDDDGFLAIVDRAKDMIAVSGFKVFPSQIEDVLMRHPAVKEALVIGVPDPRSGEVPRAFVSLETGHGGITGADLAAWLNTRVGKHERVRDVEVRPSLPKTMIGKLDRKALRADVGVAG
ncbi:long-chain fatty acid--CoA ligase [Erythrobacteraceae bacterium CFH 75059]|uniref:long-chain-fatty-acid--CoA ligase n=1 Tax=Qipengyuania thermophila TaxID=2509361 RepID=UPI0010216CAD|nr:long-chain fatty acid--CoA ligase [Qipengyuania thermophila]TCD06715.1 long-chain fatty acid--CoA ligase [Erythrobacteraceae bacterium CFH 75059]